MMVFSTVHAAPTPKANTLDVAESKHHEYGGFLGFCGPPGSACLGGKRDVKMMEMEELEKLKAYVTPLAETSAHEGGGLGFCGAPGPACLGGNRDV